MGNAGLRETAPGRARFARFETKDLQRPPSGFWPVSVVRMVEPNPFEKTRNFGAAGVAIGVCDGKLAGEDAVVGEIHRMIDVSEVTIRTIGAKCRDTGAPQGAAVPPPSFPLHAPLRLLGVEAHFFSTGGRAVTNWAKSSKSQDIEKIRFSLSKPILARFGQKETEGSQRRIFRLFGVCEVQSPSQIPLKSSKKRRPFLGLGAVRDENLAEGMGFEPTIGLLIL